MRLTPCIAQPVDVPTELTFEEIVADAEHVVPCDAPRHEGGERPPAARYWKVHCTIWALDIDCDISAQYAVRQMELLGTLCDCLVCGASAQPAFGFFTRLGPVKS